MVFIPVMSPKHAVRQYETNTGFCQERNNWPEKADMNRRRMVTKPAKVPVACILPCSSLKGSEKKGEQDGGQLSVPCSLVTALKHDPTSGATKLAV